MRLLIASALSTTTRRTFVACGLFALHGCQNQVDVEGPKGSIDGIVTIRTGSCQPVSPPCKVAPLAHDRVWVFPLIVGASQDWTHPDTSDLTPVAETTTDDAGHYAADVPAGAYSVLVDDGGEPVATKTGDGGLDVARVAAHETTVHDIQVNHAVE